MVYMAEVILFPFVAALTLAYLLDPLISRLEALHIQRPIAIIGLLGLVISLCFGVFAVLTPMVLEQTNALSKSLPNYIRIIEEKVEPFISNVSLAESGNYKLLVLSALSSLGDLPARAAKATVEAFWSSLTGTMGYIIAIINLVIIPVATFYFLRDLDNIREKIKHRIPQRNREKVFALAMKIDSILKGFFRGQMMVALFLAIFLSVGLLILKIPAGLFIGLVAGLANVVPYLAIFVGLIPATFLAYVKFGTLGSVISVVLLFVIANAIEGLVITPKLLEKEVGLHPIVVMGSMLVGGSLFGFLGIMLAVPIAAVVKVGLKELDRVYLESNYYLNRTK
tara:strand:+ start:32937 stop:33950 length:1014 start_codon:yes stop_codon:yes gene_type:complete